MSVKNTTDTKEELDRGKLRLNKWCAHCQREVWGIFVWRGSEGVFTCASGRETAYEFTVLGWAARVSPMATRRF